eukprot:SAG11_NODE_1431_length_4937_cov_1.954940_6_plen_159_part_00
MPCFAQRQYSLLWDCLYSVYLCVRAGGYCAGSYAPALSASIEDQNNYRWCGVGAMQATGLIAQETLLELHEQEIWCSARNTLGDAVQWRLVLLHPVDAAGSSWQQRSRSGIDIRLKKLRHASKPELLVWAARHSPLLLHCASTGFTQQPCNTQRWRRA